MTREEAIDVLDDMKVKIDIPKSAVTQHKRNEALDMAISALSEELSEDGTLTVHVSDGSKVSRVFVMGDNIFGGLYYPDSAETDTAKPEEGAELIDRRQIKWYGCDHEGHIKGINCDTADCSKCFFATVEHDEVMSLPVYRIPDSAENKGEDSEIDDVLDRISAEINTPNRGTCDYFIVDRIEEIINEYREGVSE